MARVKRKVNKNLVQKIVNDLESKQSFSGFSNLYEAVAKEYNEHEGTSLTGAVIGLRFKEWGDISCNTTAGRVKGKKKKEVDQSILKSAVAEAEKDGGLENFGKLHKKVTEIYNKQADEDLSESFIGKKIKEFNIPVKTTAGKRGSSSSAPVMKPKKKVVKKVSVDNDLTRLLKGKSMSIWWGGAHKIVKIHEVHMTEDNEIEFVNVIMFDEGTEWGWHPVDKSGTDRTVRLSKREFMGHGCCIYYHEDGKEKNFPSNALDGLKEGGMPQFN